MATSFEKDKSTNVPTPLTNRFGLYVHVPFCVHKCSYCDFFSFTKYDAASFGDYTARVTREIGEGRQFLDAAERSVPALTSIFFGGGTPSLLPVSDLAKVFSEIEKRFPFSSNTEITLEANPETVNEEFLKGLLSETPVNRISLGAQSFKETYLDKLERLGSRDSIYRAVELLNQFGISNFNLDFIFGIPGQTKEEIKQDIAEAVALGPKHLSSYSLSLKPAHPLYAHLPDNDLAADQYEWVSETLERLGYPQYEISNYSLPGYECAHNLLYWSGGDFLGVGPSAASRFFWGGTFHHRKSAADFTKYLQGRFSDSGFDVTTKDQTILEALFLELRQNAGVGVVEFSSRYDFDLPSARKYPELIESGHLVSSAGVVQLSSKGRMLAETVALQLSE